MAKLIRWKVIAIAGIIAMAVSLTSGGISGVRLGALLLRAVVGGGLFAAFAVGVNILVARVFPEIIDSGYAPGEESEGEAEMAQHVDIVVPEVNPLRSDDDDGMGAEVLADENDSEPATPVVSLEDDGVADPRELPDLDRFSDAFEEQKENEPGSSATQSDVPGGDKDPGELAQAIHTVLARDEKG